MSVQVFPDVELETSRLRLRPFRAGDVDAVVAAANDSLTRRWLPMPSPYTRDDAVAWCTLLAPGHRTAGRGLVRAVDLDGALAGSIDLKRTDWLAGVTEIGYWTSPAWRGRGVMPEATAALARWALTVGGMHRVELRIATGNRASLQVAAKAGFTREGVARSAGYLHTGRVDLEIWSLLRTDV